MFVNCNVTSLSQTKVNKSPEIGPNIRNPVMPVTVETVWPAAREMLRTMLNPDIFNLWFAPIRATALEGDHLTLEVANDFCEVWLKDNYLGLLQDVMALAAGRQVQVRFKVAGTNSHIAATMPSVPQSKTVEAPSERGATSHDLSFNPKNTFETFVVGHNNNFAYAAAQAV